MKTVDLHKDRIGLDDKEHSAAIAFGDNDTARLA